MGRIYINTDAVSNLKSNIHSKRNSCRGYCTRVSSVRNHLYWKVLNRQRIKARLNDLRRRIRTQSELLYSYSQALGDVNSNMSDTDERLKNDAQKLGCRMDRITRIIDVCQNGSERSRKIWGLDMKNTAFIASIFGSGISGASLSTKALSEGLKK